MPLQAEVASGAKLKPSFSHVKQSLEKLFDDIVNYPLDIYHFSLIIWVFLMIFKVFRCFLATEMLADIEVSGR